MRAVGGSVAERRFERAVFTGLCADNRGGNLAPSRTTPELAPRAPRKGYFMSRQWRYPPGCSLPLGEIRFRHGCQIATTCREIHDLAALRRGVVRVEQLPADGRLHADYRR